MGRPGCAEYALAHHLTALHIAWDRRKHSVTRLVVCCWCKDRAAGGAGAQEALLATVSCVAHINCFGWEIVFSSNLGPATALPTRQPTQPIWRTATDLLEERSVDVSQFGSLGSGWPSEGGFWGRGRPSSLQLPMFTIHNIYGLGEARSGLNRSRKGGPGDTGSSPSSAPQTRPVSPTRLP